MAGDGAMDDMLRKSTQPSGSNVTVMRNMKRENQLESLRRMLETNQYRIGQATEQCARIVREINRLKRMDAEDAGHIMVRLDR